MSYGTGSYSDVMMRPGDYELVDAMGCPTPDGSRLAHDLVDCARMCESRFGVLYDQMREYERFWTQTAVRYAFPQDKELEKSLPAFPVNKGRILAGRVVRANVKKPVRFRIRLSAAWSQDQRKATQELERYCYGAFSMGDDERLARLLGALQPTLAWFNAVRGASILIAFVRNSPRQKYADDLGAIEPFVLRTPDPLTSVWDETSYGLSFFASTDWRQQSEFYGMTEMETMRPSMKRMGYCETTNVWWCDEEQQVWNATVVEGSHFLIPPTNHTTRRKLKRLPVIIESPAGSPKEALIRDGDEISLADHYQGIYEANRITWPVENYINALQMKQLRDYSFRQPAIAAERTPTTDEARDWTKGLAMMNLGPDGRIYDAPPPQVSEAIIRFQAYLEARSEDGSMPSTAITGVSDGMTGVAIQERTLQGDAVAGPVSDALRRTYKAAAALLIHQHRALNRQINVKGADARRRMFIAKVDAAALPPPEDYLLEAVHDPVLVRDEYRQAQTAAIWRQVGRSRTAIFDEMLENPTDEDALSREEQLEAMPELMLITAIADYQRKYPNEQRGLSVLMQMLQNRLAQSAPQQGQTNAPRAGTATDVEPLGLPPGGPPVAPAASNPTSPMGQEILGMMGGEMGGNQSGY